MGTVMQWNTDWNGLDTDFCALRRCFATDYANLHRFFLRLAALFCCEFTQILRWDALLNPLCHHIGKNPCPIRGNPCSIASHREKSVSNPFKSVCHCITPGKTPCALTAVFHYSNALWHLVLSFFLNFSPNSNMKAYQQDFVPF